MAFDLSPDGLDVLRMQSAAESLYRTGKLLERIPKDFPETIRVKDGIRQHVPVPEAVGRACEGQKISLFTGAQCRLRPAVSRPLYEQPDDKQGCDGAKGTEADDMPLKKCQK